MTQTKRKTNKILLAVLSLVFVLTVAMGFGALRGSATTTTYADTTLSGEGTVASPYLIGTKADLQQFADIIGSSNGVSACAKLTSDIDLKDGVVYLATWSWYSYKGTFDGNGHTIYNLSRLNAESNHTQGGRVGLFDYIDGATIKNLTVRGTITSSTCPVGGIVGQGTGAFVIKNCVNEVNVTANGGAGGVIYQVNSSSGALIEDCVNKGTVRSNGTVAGGIIGYTDSNATSLTIRKCYNSGTISADNVNVGGIAGVCWIQNSNIITDCYNTGAVTGSQWVGGIVGAKWGSADSNSYVRNCHNYGTVTKTETTSSYIGGISGSNPSALENCYYLSGCVSNGTDGTTALNAEQMKVKSNFVNWDFEKVWDIEGNYPILRPSPVEVEFDQNVLLNGETSTTTVSNLNGETAASLLTEGELERYSGGESVNIYLEVNNESGSTGIPAEDKSVAKAAVASAEAKEGAYLDLKLYKQLSNDADRTAIHESATAFDITVDIPAELAAPYGYTREYSIIRVHNGVAETLESTVSDGKISFSTDKFSTYLIAYSDEFDENGEYVEFTTSINGDNIRYTNDIVSNNTVEVNYKITRNDGFNSILLIPEYDKNVFAIDSVEVNNDTVLGEAELTQGNGTMKILLENTGDKYTALDEDNEFFLTITYRIIAATEGEYNFGLVLTSNAENGESAAYYITDANGQKGDQNRIGIKVIQTETLTLLAKTVITIGHNNEYNQDDYDNVYDYFFIYGKQAVSVNKVDELPAYEEFVNNFKVFYTYNGDATVAVTWYYAGYEYDEVEHEYRLVKGDALSAAPITAGQYLVEISAPATATYAAAEAYAFVRIEAKTVNIKVDDKESVYGGAIVPLTYSYVNTEDAPFDGDDYYIVLSTDVTSGSPVGYYPINGSVNADISDKYYVNITGGTYEITQKALTITALGQTAEYTGSEPTVDQTKYTVSISGLTISGVVITKEAGVNVGTYKLTPSYTNANYDITFVDGTFEITKKAITITALNQTAEYTGSEPTVDQTKYTVTIGTTVYEYNDNAVSGITGISIAKAAGVNVGTYKLTPSCSDTNYTITAVDGTFTITSVGADIEAIKALFNGLTTVYDKTEQNLLSAPTQEALTAKFITGYTATGNLQIYARDEYIITVTVTADSNHNIDGNSTGTFTVKGKITPAEITVKAVDKGHVYGDQPAALTYSVTSGTLYNGDDIHEVFTVFGNETMIPLASDTDVGTYAIKIVSASNENYTITTEDGIYTVSKAPIADTNGDEVPDDADDPTSENPASGVKISVSANNNYYNRELSNSVTAMVGKVVLDSSAYTLLIKDDNGNVVDGNTVLDAGTYTITVAIADTNNYDGATKSATFEILKVKLEGVSFTYEGGTATWTAVANDIGKTENETGVEIKAIKDGTTITYYVYDGTTLIGTYDAREFSALAATTYKVIAVADNANYIQSESVMISAHSVTFTGGTHPQTQGDPANMPATVYIFNGQSFTISAVKPTIDGYFFKNWNDGSNDYAEGASYTVNADAELVAIWELKGVVITFKYTDTSATENTDVFTFNLTFGAAITYSVSTIDPEKDSGTQGFRYVFMNKWSDGEQEYTINVENGVATLNGITVPETDKTFVAVYEAQYNSYTITYYFSEDNGEYVQVGDTQTVRYDDVITYRTYNGEEYAWFIKDYWYGNETRTASVPVKMPAGDISVYGTYKFDIGQGDVNADGKVNADDIAIYRQWIVGGYEMTVVESGTEWALVSGGNYNAQTRYYLKRVADNNADESKDIRDVSITRMAIVGGYDWDISTGEVVTGANIGRTKTATTVASVISGLTEYGRARMYADASATTDIAISAHGNIYLDLGGNTLTVKSFVLNATDKNATITVKNGTIITTDGITITAPYGNVILENLTGYVGEEQVNLQAADSSLHFAGAVRFYKEQAAEPVAVPVYVAENTHVVVEQAATLAVEKVIVATVANNNEFVAAPAASITIDNKTANEVVIDGMVSNTVSTLAELVAAASEGGAYVLGADFTYNGTLGFKKDTTITLNGHTLTSSNSNAMAVTEGATLTISGNGNVIAQEVCVLVLDGSTVIINGGTYTSIDNFVVGTNGSTGRGENKITINGGTFNGGITTAGYVACGIYVANSDTVIVNGGAFNITNGVGILARSGNTTVGENVVFNVTGNGSLGQVGDSRVVLPSGQVLVVDLAAGYPGGVPALTNNSVNKVYYIVKDEAGLNAALSNGGEVVLVNDIAINATAVINGDVTINLNGHDINANGVRAIWVKSGDVEIKGEGIISANGNIGESSSVIRVGDGAANADTAKLTIGADVTVSTDKCYGVTVFGTNQAALVVNGKIEVTGNVSAISGNGSANLAATSIVINDGAVVRAAANNAIYHPQAGTLTVNGGEIVGLGGIEAKGGNVVVNGGTITATAPVASHNVNNNGSSTSGYALVAVENSGYKGEGNFTISGGIINGAVAVIEDIAAEWNPAITISGGTFSADPSAYVAENSVVYEESGDYVVVSAVVNSLSELTDAIANGRSKIVLGADITLTSTVIITNDVVINLNGHNITANGVRAIWVKSGDVEIKGNGTISVNGNIDSSSSVIRVGDGAANADTAKLTIGADVAVSTDKCYGITVFGKNAEDVSGYGQYLVVNGMVAVTGESAAISGNGTGELAKTNITVNNGATVKADDAGIYHPQGGTLTVNNGATVEGGTALYIKSGTVNIADGAIIKAIKAEYTEYYYNGNGDNITGDAIVIDNCYYPNGNATLNFGANLANTVTVAATGASKVATYWFVKTESQLKAAVAAGGYLTIGENINLTEQIVVDKELTINLNGKKISNLIDIWNDADGVKAWSLISVQAGSLIVTGNGTLEAKENDCYALDVRNGAALTIENGTYVGNISAVYVIEGTLTVNGGMFSIQQKSIEDNDCRYLLNCFDAPYKNGTATITVTGGSFVDFNPADCAAEGVNTNFVAAGYTITEINGVYTVSK